MVFRNERVFYSKHKKKKKKNFKVETLQDRDSFEKRNLTGRLQTLRLVSVTSLLW